MKEIIKPKPNFYYFYYYTYFLNIGTIHNKIKKNIIYLIILIFKNKIYKTR